MAGYTPVILTEDVDYLGIQTYLGCDLGQDSGDFPYEAIVTRPMLGEAETYITSKINAQIANGNNVPTVDQILNNQSPAVPADLVWLKNAVSYYVAALYCNAATNAINTSVTDGDQTIDRGGIGTQWQQQKMEAYKDCDLALKKITNWLRWRTI